jgi:uroporphyrinogen III methyltransferase / synthase
VSDQPLAGRTIAVTRTREQAGALADRLEDLGAEVVAFPVIETADPQDWGPADRAIDELAGYDWVVLTSTNGVDRFFARLLERDLDARALSGVKVAAVGSATADRLMDHLIRPDLVPADFRAEGLLEAFRERGIGPGARILIPRALDAREILPEELRADGAVVDVVPVYRVVPAEPDPEALARLREGEVDVVAFASGGTAKSFLDVVEGAGLDPRAVMSSLLVASIGPVTTASVGRLGYEVDIEAEESTMPSLVEAIAGHYCASGDDAACGVDVD